MPGDANVYLPGLALSSSTSSLIDFAGITSGFTNRPLGEVAAMVTGVKLSGV